MTNIVELRSGWIFFRWRERWDLLEKTLVHIVQVGAGAEDMLPGRESLTHFTGDVRRVMPKN